MGFIIGGLTGFLINEMIFKNVDPSKSFGSMDSRTVLGASILAGFIVDMAYEATKKSKLISKGTL